MMKKRIWAGLLVLAAVFLAGCAEKELPPTQKEGVLIYACMNPQDRMMQSYVNLFNKDHEDVQIEVRDYSGEEGIQRLLVELAVGQVPDIMDLHMIGETEDILPYGNPLDKGSIEYGQCSFDCEEFRGILSFLEQFPMEFETPLSSESVEEELNWRVLNGKQMLEAQTFHSLFGVCGLDTYFGERAAFVGYPTADGTYGSFLLHMDQNWLCPPPVKIRRLLGNLSAV